jgi:hypothetical protein
MIVTRPHIAALLNLAEDHLDRILTVYRKNDLQTEENDFAVIVMTTWYPPHTNPFIQQIWFFQRSPAIRNLLSDGLIGIAGAHRKFNLKIKGVHNLKHKSGFHQPSEFQTKPCKEPLKAYLLQSRMELGENGFNITTIPRPPTWTPS